MRVSKIKEFENSTEVTIIFEGNDAQALDHVTDKMCQSGKCAYPRRFELGKALLERLHSEVFRKIWRSWQD